MSSMIPTLQFFNEDPVQQNGFDEEDEDETSNLSADGKSGTKRANRKRKATVSGGPSDSRKSRGKQKIEIEFMQEKNRRYSTFSKRKTGLMKKAYQLAKLTGAEVLLLVASETNHVYTFATEKLRTIIDSENGISLIQTCLLSGSNQSATPPTNQNAEPPATTASNDSTVGCAPTTLPVNNDYTDYTIVDSNYQDAASAATNSNYTTNDNIVQSTTTLQIKEKPPSLQRCPTESTANSNAAPEISAHLVDLTPPTHIDTHSTEKLSTGSTSNPPLTPSIEFLMDILNNKKALPSESGESLYGGDLGDMQSPGIPQELLREYLKNDSLFGIGTPNSSLLSASFLNTPSLSATTTNNSSSAFNHVTNIPNPLTQSSNNNQVVTVVGQDGVAHRLVTAAAGGGGGGSTLMFFPPDDEMSGTLKILPTSYPMISESTGQYVSNTNNTHYYVTTTTLPSVVPSSSSTSSSSNNNNDVNRHHHSSIVATTTTTTGGQPQLRHEVATTLFFPSDTSSRNSTTVDEVDTDSVFK